jgi:hypothetical protein
MLLIHSSFYSLYCKPLNNSVIYIVCLILFRKCGEDFVWHLGGETSSNAISLKNIRQEKCNVKINIMRHILKMWMGWNISLQCMKVALMLKVLNLETQYFFFLRSRSILEICICDWMVEYSHLDFLGMFTSTDLYFKIFIQPYNFAPVSASEFQTQRQKYCIL